MKDLTFQTIVQGLFFMDQLIEGAARRSRLDAVKSVIDLAVHKI